jgi:hypothetical protein
MTRVVYILHMAHQLEHREVWIWEVKIIAETKNLIQPILMSLILQPRVESHHLESVKRIAVRVQVDHNWILIPRNSKCQSIKQTEKIYEGKSMKKYLEVKLWISLKCFQIKAIVDYLSYHIQSTFRNLLKTLTLKWSTSTINKEV